MPSSTFFQRVTDRRADRQAAAHLVRERILRRPHHHVGRRALQHGDVRAPVSAIAGTSVTAVAPLPITTTFLPL